MKSTAKETTFEPEVGKIADKHDARLERHGRYWAVYEGEALICLTVYKKGAKALVRRLRLQT
jgi:hypothetical protein